VVGVVDSGIDPAHPEFIGNLSPLSADIVPGRGVLVPASTHGTEVAGLIAAKKNNIGVHGVAYDATLLMVRADTPGSCNPSCAFSNTNIATAIDYAVANGAKVINFSQAGNQSPTGPLLAALQRAANAGVIMVFAAGNDGDTLPDASSRFAASADAKGLGIIAGASTNTNAIATFSDRAGTTMDSYVVAPGVNVRTTGDGTSTVIVSGTSFSAPMVAGAAALLLDKFPNLSGAEVVRILIDTAADLGTPGHDTIFGAGLVDLAAALAPQGALSLPTFGGRVSATGSTVMMGTAFGDAVVGDQAAASLLRSGIITDKYDRTYVADLTGSFTRMPDSRFDLASFARSSVYRRGTSGFVPGIGAFQMSYTDEWGALDEAALFPNLAQERGFENLSFSFVHALDAKTSVGVTHGAAFANTFDTAPETGLLRSVDAGGAYMRFAQDGTGLTLLHQLDRRTTIGFAAASARFEPFDGAEPVGREFAAVQVNRAVGDHVVLGAQLGALHERGTMLDTIATGAFDGIEGATTRFVTLSASYRLGDLTLVAGASRGWTGVSEHGSALLHSYSGIETSSYSVGAVWQTPLAGHVLGFAISQPLRVESGRATLDVATGRDFINDSILYDSRTLNLAPTGREVDMELSHGFWNGGPLSLQTNLIYRMNPNHFATAADALLLMFQADVRF
jgi:hypothetical protein